MSTCAVCSREITRWIDAFTVWGPATRWRQYQSTSEARTRRSEEMLSIRVEERAALIRQQIALIKAACDHDADSEAVA